MLSAETQTDRPAAAHSPAEKLDDRRRIPRIALPLPMRLEALVDRDNGWNEMTRLLDVSSFGAGFVLKRPLKRGRLVLLTMPMPRQLRSFDYAESQYKIWALVRRCLPIGEAGAMQEYAIGAAFTGKNPPEGHFDNPSKLYDITRRDESGSGLFHLRLADPRPDESHLPIELRKQTRFFIPEPLRIEQVDTGGNIIFSEDTVSENLSYGGAAVFTTLNAPAGTFVRVTSDRFAVTILSIVRGRRTGADGIPRLHLEFIDRLFPLAGIAQG